ncbi:MAG TPA: hypothetical protein VFZ81_13055 [Burkholderiales bacterium]
MRFRIGGTFAECAACRRHDFFPALALNAGRRDVYICAHCGNEALYSELLSRMGKESARPADEADRPDAG